METKEVKKILISLSAGVKKGEKIKFLKDNIHLVEDLELSKKDIFLIVGFGKDWYEEKKDILKFSKDLDEILKKCK